MLSSHSSPLLPTLALMLLAMGPVFAQSPTQTADSPSSPSQRVMAVLPIAPPLSIHESCLMLRQLIEELESSREPLPEARVAQLDRVVGAIGQYVERVDRQNPELANYSWRRLISHKVPEADWRTYQFTLRNPIDEIAALALRAHHGDIEVSVITAIDENGAQWDFNQRIIVTGGRTRVDICQLPLPTRLKTIRLTCRRTEPTGHVPRLFIDVGVSPEPEHARQARHYLQVAREELGRGALRESAGNLRRAFDLLQEYQRARRY